MRGSRAGLLAVAGGLLMASGVGVTVSTAAAAPVEQVRICHQTGSGKFTSQSVDPDSIANRPNGHHTHVGDIIPPFEYVDGGVVHQYGGQNWADGAATWSNGCVVPDGPQDPDPDPQLTEVATEAPAKVDPCGTDDDAVDLPETGGVTYQVAGDPSSGSATVTAVAQDGYVLTGDTSWELVFTDVPCTNPDPDPEPEPEPVEASAQAPTTVDPCGTSDDTYTVPSVEGVTYQVGGAAVDAGAYPGSGTVTVSAVAQDGYVLTGETTWDLAFTDVPCTQPGDEDPVDEEPGDEDPVVDEPGDEDPVVDEPGDGTDRPGDGTDRPRDENDRPGDENDRPGDENDRPQDRNKQPRNGHPQLRDDKPATVVRLAVRSTEQPVGSQVDTSAEVPTAVAAGLTGAGEALPAGSSASHLPAAGLGMAGGGVLLLAAGGVLAIRRRGAQA